MVCVACRKFMRTKKSGVLIEEMRPVKIDYSTPSQTHEEEAWAPYQLWLADLYECPGCKAQMVGGFGSFPLAQEHVPDYERVRDVHGPVLLRVEDCGPRHGGRREV